MNPTIIILCGPTASGKTALALELAQKLNAEIVSADSGQVYVGMNIGTAKPTLDEQSQVPFHLIDIINPDQQFSAADFRERAVQSIQDIQSRGKRVLVVGGTGLYLKALEGGLFEGPARDLEIRHQLEIRIEKEGIAALHEELEKIDPEAAAAIPSNNRHRIIRALEVYQITGQPISEFWKEHQFKKHDFEFLKIGLNVPKKELHLKIEDRVDMMMKLGLVEEVSGLLKKWGPEATGLRIIGYKELIEHLKGKLSLEEAVLKIKIHTRQYAKRQMTWFRKDLEIFWAHNRQEVDVKMQELLTK